MKYASWILAITFLCIAASPVRATVITTNSEAAFQSSFSGFTLVNLDSTTLSGYGSLGAANGALGLLGLQSVGFDAAIAGGQAYQIAKPGRDRLILNGFGFGGEVAFDFDNDVFGVGALSNFIDYGRIRAFSGTGLSGDFIGEVTMSAGGFGGLISSQAIRSIEVTCDFNGDLACGVYDLQFSSQPSSSVPAPLSVGYLLLGLLSLALARRPAR